jgi:asparagine N-glycosylation enzyme membrane subunit Stt3
MIALGLYYSQAQRALILEDLGVFKSIARGWEVFRKNIGGLLVVAVIGFFINLIIGLIIAVPIYIAILPLLFKILEGGITSWSPFILAVTFLLCYTPIAWFLNGILITYTETVWTVIYMRVTKPNEEAPLLLQPADA